MSSTPRARRLLASLAAVCYYLSAVVAVAEPAKIKKALIVGIDGCRFDAIQAADTPHLDQLIRHGAVSRETLILGERYKRNDTVSGPGWSSILTGVWADKHGVQDNKFVEPHFDKFPHFFHRLKSFSPQAMTASIVDWKPIHEHIVSAADVATTVPEGVLYLTGDEQITREGARLLAESDPTAAFVYLGQVDETGHKFGFHPSVDAYCQAVERVDGHLGKLLGTIKDRKSFGREDWLIVVTSDHGGKGTSHGGGHNDPEVLHSFLIVSGESATRGTIESPVYLVDVAPTVLAHLGVPLAAKWQLDGKPVGLRKQ